MALLRQNGARKIKIQSQDTYILGDAHEALVGTFAVHIVNDGSFVGTITVKARSRTPDADNDGVTFQPTIYEKLYLNGAVGDGSLVSTGITTTSIILVPASGLQIALDVTAFTSGSCSAYIVPLQGAAA